MSSDKGLVNDNLRADVVIAGGGGAGVPAAVAAAEQGARKVILLEKRSKIGGNAVYPAGLFAANSYLQKRLGIDAPCEKVFKMVMQYTHWKTSPRLVRALVDRSGDTIDWLENKGVKFTGVLPHYPNQVPAVFHISSGPGITGAVIIRALVKSGEAMGIRFICHAEVKRIITDARGVVTGVIAATEQGEVKIDTRSVIIATGGFAGNTRLLKRYVPSFDEKEMMGIGIRHKGDGLRMATEVGAVREGSITLEMGAPFSKVSRYLSPLISRPNTIWVNKDGKRFADETVVHLFSEAANTLFRQPDKTSYSLFDDSIKGSILDDGLGVFEEYSLGKRPWRERVYKELQSEAEKGRIKISDSWDEIARWMEVDLSALKKTIDEYNSCCDRGYDDIFAKERRYLMPLRTPPYYAFKCGIGLVTTHGGIKINERMEVLDIRDNPIAGLYAAGVDTGGTDSDTYNVIISGHSFGFSVNSGRIAGENAARYVSGNK